MAVVRIASFLAALFAASIASADCYTDTVLVDWNALSEPTKTNTTAYKDLFASIPEIADHMGYCTIFTTAMKTAMWAAMDEASQNACVQTPVPKPAGYPADVTIEDVPPVPDQQTCFTTSEAIATLAAKYAHAFCHEIEGSFPWSLTDFKVEDLDGLFDPTELFSNTNHSHIHEFDFTETTSLYGTCAAVQFIVDHDPGESLGVFTSVAGALPYQGTTNMALRWIHKYAQDFSHSSGPGDSYTSISVLDGVSPLNYDDDVAIPWTARGGCQFTAPWMTAIFRAVNIPAIRINGFTGGSGHATAEIPALNKVLIHGDDPYNWEERQVPTLEERALTAWSTWNDRTWRPGCDFQTSLEACVDGEAINDFVADYYTTYVFGTYPSNGMISNMCSDPEFWTDYRKAWLTPHFEPCQEQIATDIYNNLSAQSGCDGGGY